METFAASLRSRVAARDLPDEGMRGSDVDEARLLLVQDAESVRLLADSLWAANDPACVADAAAAVRSLAVTPASAHTIAGMISLPLCDAARRLVALRWTLPALARFCQFRECHPALLSAGAVGILEQILVVAPVPAAEYAVLAAVALSFLSESEPSAAMQVGTAHLLAFVAALDARLAISGLDEAQRVVQSRAFFGLPLFYRPRFLLQAILGAVAHGPPQHLVTAVRDTPILRLLRGIKRGELQNDTPQNKPFGSPDAGELVDVLARHLLDRMSLYEPTLSPNYAEHVAMLVETLRLTTPS
jgi:hypothetical protein